MCCMSGFVTLLSVNDFCAKLQGSETADISILPERPSEPVCTVIFFLHVALFPLIICCHI